jgi:hypothetical protein
MSSVSPGRGGGVSSFLAWVPFCRSRWLDVADPVIGWRPCLVGARLGQHELCEVLVSVEV